MDFVVVGRRSAVESHPARDVVRLERSAWDDFGFKTLFLATVFLRDGTRRTIGELKIVEQHQESGQTPLPERFGRLGPDFASLGQDIGYYEALMDLPAAVRRAYLRAIRDAAADATILRAFEETRAWQVSVLRFGQAQNALEAGSRLLSGRTETFGRLSFDFTRRLADRDVVVPFGFEDDDVLPGRCNVVIGYNGAGKTKLLADLAMTASKVSTDSQEVGGARAGVLSGSDTTFGAVVAVSYSAFDSFALPPTGGATGETEFFGYVYCGLRRPKQPRAGYPAPGWELKSTEAIRVEFAQALRTARRRDSASLRRALSLLDDEPSFGRVGVRAAGLLARPRATADRHFDRMSSGHKIVVNIVAQLAAHLQKRSLVLIDEPESHLHPPLLAAFLRAVQSLLHDHDSFAILATHSPVVLQEIPSRYIRVLDRAGDTLTVLEPEVETFGENLGAITRYVFSLDSSKTDYQAVLRELARRYSIAQIEEIFGGRLGAQAQALVLRYRREAE